MISILSTETNNFRTFGWVQDPGNLCSLCDVVAVFDKDSLVHHTLVDEVIPRLIEERDGRDDCIDELNKRPLRISYTKLVGTSFSPRSMSRCNGIIQATVKGQKREFIGDWPADNFVRWAHCFGFIRYNYSDDTFEITETGLKLSRAKKEMNRISNEEEDILVHAIMAYPPAVRILRLLSEDETIHLTKFELGRKLGFVGEDGFTSMPQNILIQVLNDTENARERNSMKADWEGSSDKYARMIAGWLAKLGLVKKETKKVVTFVGETKYEESLGQSYMITAKGMLALRMADGRSKHKRIPKNICWEMLATKGADREYLRTRRAYLIKYLVESQKKVSIEMLIEYLSVWGMEETAVTVQDDMRGLINIGLNIVCDGNYYRLDDEINDFIIPKSKVGEKSNITELKDKIRESLHFLSHEYLSLIDLAYDSKQNRLFEMKTLELLTEECKFKGLHLGGVRKPDGIIYTEELEDNYGVIIDTKAYSKGYNLPISQADEMERYIGENQTRDEKINPNCWWTHFGKEIKLFYFMFISGHFKGNFEAQLKRISRNKNVNGTAMSIVSLLLLVEGYKAKKFTHKSISDYVFKNCEFSIECRFVKHMLHPKR